MFLPERYEAVNLHGRPFLLASFALQRWASGLDPAPLRALNLLALLAASWFVWRLARALPGAGFGGAMLCALAFAVHPEHLDGVSWIAGRGAVLSTAITLGALLAWVEGRRGIALAAFAFGLGVYELGIVLPAVILCLQGRYVLRRRSWWGMAVIAAVFAVLQVGFLSHEPRVGLGAASPIHALRHPFQLAWPFFDSPRFAFYNVSAKAFVRERLGLFVPLALAALVGGGALLARLRMRPWLRRRMPFVSGALVALLPAVAYGHFSPRTSFLASALAALALLPRCRSGRVLLALYVLALAIAARDENRFWARGAALSREVVTRAAAGEAVRAPADLGRLVPLFPGPETLATALRLFPDGVPRGVGDELESRASRGR